MKKKFIAIVLFSAIAIFAVGVRFSAADDAATSVSSNNVRPVISVVHDDSDSSAAVGGPTNVGDNVTFTVTATDANNDGFYLAVCKTDAITEGTGGGAPSCPGGAWVVSSSASGNASSATTISETYQTVALDAQSNDWYAFACDNNPAGTAGSHCSDADSGTAGIQGNTGVGGGDYSPFFVNHRPSISSVSITNTSGGNIAPNDTVRFTVNSVDGDNIAAQDTVRIFICSGNADQGGVTTAFDLGTGTCTNGTLLCSIADGAPGTAHCDATTDANSDGTPDLVEAPAAIASDYNVKAFIYDNHDFPASALTSQNYSVVNAAPFVSSFTAASITGGQLLAGASYGYSFTGVVKDPNGDMDIKDASGKFYDSAVVGINPATCTQDDNKCYTISSCSLSDVSSGSGHKEATGNDTAATITCNTTVWYNINYSSGWKPYAFVEDQANASGTLSDTNSYSTPSIQSIDVKNASDSTPVSISYASMAPGDYASPTSSTTVYIANAGNSIFDTNISGTNMCQGLQSNCTTVNNTIGVGNQRWKDSTFTYTSSSTDGSTALVATSGTPTCLNNNVAVRPADHTTYTNGTYNLPIYFGMFLPLAIESGSYSGTNTFAATTCP